jgi:hypothetical protein
MTQPKSGADQAEIELLIPCVPFMHRQLQGRLQHMQRQLGTDDVGLVPACLHLLVPAASNGFI